jgi:hypothetical protein
MPCTGRDQDGIARDDVAARAVDFHFPRALEQEVDLLGRRVVVPLRPCARRERGLRK